MSEFIEWKRGNTIFRKSDVAIVSTGGGQPSITVESASRKLGTWTFKSAIDGNEAYEELAELLGLRKMPTLVPGVAGQEDSEHTIPNRDRHTILNE